MARMPPSADTDDTDCVHAFIRHLPSVYIRDGEAASVASVVQSLVDGLAREVPAPPSARGVRLASGRLTRSGRRHGGTESGFEVGLRAVSPTRDSFEEGNFYHRIHRNALRATQKRPEKNVFRTIRPLLFHLDAYWGGLASGRLTRSRRRHGGTESGFEVGLRAASSTFCLPRGTWGPIRTE